MEQNLNYERAYAELQAIYEAINSEQVSIDELTEKVKRAAYLIDFCQNKLRSTEEEISKIISSLPQPPPAIQKEQTSQEPDSTDPGGEGALPF